MAAVVLIHSFNNAFYNSFKINSVKYKCIANDSCVKSNMANAGHCMDKFILVKFILLEIVLTCPMLRPYRFLRHGSFQSQLS